MSARANCYGHAAMESWNYDLKVEAIHVAHEEAHEQARRCVFEYFEVDCD